jgi:hypothetical protein
VEVNPYGLLGLLSGNVSELPEDLDEFYKKQFHFYEGEDGKAGHWGVGNGLLMDRSGKQVVQVGDNKTAFNGDNIRDPSKIRYDEELGNVAEFDNLERQYDWKKVGLPMLASVIGAGLGGAAMGLGGAGEAAGGLGLAGGGEVAAGGAMDMFGSAAIPGQAGTIFDGAAGLMGGGSGIPAGMSPDGIVAPGMQNAAGADSWLINHGMSGAAGGTGTGLLSGNPLAHVGGASGAGSGILSYAMDNPLRTLMLANTVASSLGGGQNSSASSSPEKGGGGKPVSIGSKRGAYKPNPITLKQLQQFMFTGS